MGWLFPLRHKTRLERAALREDARGQRQALEQPGRAIPDDEGRYACRNSAADDRLSRVEAAGQGAWVFLWVAGRGRGVLQTLEGRPGAGARAVYRPHLLCELERDGGLGLPGGVVDTGQFGRRGWAMDGHARSSSRGARVPLERLSRPRAWDVPLPRRERAEDTRAAGRPGSHGEGAARRV